LTDTPAAHIVIIETDDSPVPEVAAALREVPASVRVTDRGPALDTALHPSPHVTVLVVTTADDLVALPKRVKSVSRSPLFAIVAPDLLERAASHPALDDFAIVGCSTMELQARVRRLVRLHPESGEVLRRGDLALNTATCEVSLGGRLIELTFKEYTLLKFLAGNPGRVHTREVLLDKVWGYDYYGGDRTVDVHVRRLRSKIEDANHTFIDTVRNMGYRFRKDV
jgi:two-component system, OmpR family, alkaline phosphatase synthesis response regulator PhoP